MQASLVNRGKVSETTYWMSVTPGLMAADTFRRKQEGLISTMGVLYISGYTTCEFSKRKGRLTSLNLTLQT